MRMIIKAPIELALNDIVEFEETIDTSLLENTSSSVLVSVSVSICGDWDAGDNSELVSCLTGPRSGGPLVPVIKRLDLGMSSVAGLLAADKTTELIRSRCHPGMPSLELTVTPTFGTYNDKLGDFRGSAERI